ncbi:MAG TPA: long-chain fatty acid--CoA ligase [Solirubrobacteraceae bacterium]|jgi:long-chain acyl-CoA synthetase|nr:long-chain fatty acid--CoA ligase [Solirubrobacteraceae bacterium]
MSGNIASILTETAERHGDRIALKLDGVEIPYRAVEEASARVAGLLKQKGVQADDRVAVMLPNVPYFAFIYYGVLRIGAAVVPINPRYETNEVAYHVKDSGAKLLFAWHDFMEAAQRGAQEAGVEVIAVEPEKFEAMLGEVEPDHEVVERDPDDVGVILYTSGTTGAPKGAVLTHGNLRMSTDIATTLVELSEDDVILGALPFFHVFGQACGLNGATKLGACLSLIARFHPSKTLEVIERDRVTVFEGVPTMYSAVLHADDRDRCDTSSLRIGITGGQAMPVEVMERFEEAFGIEVLEGYGLSETTSVGTFNHPGDRKPGSVGKPVDGVEVKILDDDGNEVEQGEIGEIAIKGDSVMAGYWNQEEATSESLRDGWFYTGDMGHVDEDGFVFIDDRKKDMIIRGGENVYPREIEEVLYRHGAIAEAAVIGVKDERLGEEVGAAVVVKPGEDLSVEDIQEYVKGKLAKYKYPRKIWFSDELPKGPTGKILKREIEVPD